MVIVQFSFCFYFRFDRVVTNVGNMYNGHDGLFVAPVTGMYVFFWTVSCTAVRDVATELVKDGTAYGFSFADSVDANDYVNGGNTVVLQVNHGQHVWVRYTDYEYDGSKHNYRTLEGGNRDTFSGWLLYEM